MTTTCAPGPADDHRAVPAAVRSRAACATAAGEASVPQLRRFVLWCAHRLGLPESTCDTAGLVVSELVTNSVLHSGSHSVTVLVDVGPAHLRISVRDCGCWRERPDRRRSSDDADALCGRGLDLVRALTQRFTVSSGPAGTVVEAHVGFAPAQPVLSGAVR